MAKEVTIPLDLAAIQGVVDLKIQELKDQGFIVSDDFTDLRYRAEAIRMATTLVDQKAFDKSEIVDKTLQVAAFLLSEPYGNTTVQNYVDQYHYHYDGSGNEITGI